MGLATLLSRILGMAREMVYARFMGDGMVASAFFYAFQVPNLFRRLLGEGALTAAQRQGVFFHSRIGRHHHEPHHDRLCILDRPGVWHGIN